jgi:Ca2+-binding EF-hand superfamily protein
LFSKIDVDQDGLISIKELVKYLKDKYVRTSEGVAELVIREYDSDFDGHLSFDEFS